MTAGSTGRCNEFGESFGGSLPVEGLAGAGRSAAETYGLEGVRAARPEIVVPRKLRLRSELVVVHRTENRASSMIRPHNGIAVTGIEPTLVALAAALDAEGFEIACEDARRRRLTSIASLRAYVDQFAHRSGIADMRGVLDDLDPVHPARSTLEAKTRRLLVANGLTDFEREFALTWNDRTYRIIFATWDKVTHHPDRLLSELTTTLAAA